MAGLSAAQLVEDFIHDKALIDVFVRGKQIDRLGYLGFVGGVVGVPQILQGDADGILELLNIRIWPA
jgi:hypothetical protein